MLSLGGEPHPPIWNRVFWALLGGAVAIALLLAGGLVALQTGAILMALPFSVVLIGICAATLRAFHGEHQKFLAAERQQLRAEVAEQVTADLAAALRIEDDDIMELVSPARRSGARGGTSVGRQIAAHFRGEDREH